MYNEPISRQNRAKSNFWLHIRCLRHGIRCRLILFNSKYYWNSKNKTKLCERRPTNDEHWTKIEVHWRLFLSLFFFLVVSIKSCTAICHDMHAILVFSGSFSFALHSQRNKSFVNTLKAYSFKHIVFRCVCVFFFLICSMPESERK